MRAAKAGKLFEEERIVHRADAEEHVAGIAIEIAFLARVCEDRHHPRDAAAAGDAEKILVELRIEGRLAERPEEPERGADDIAAEQPFGEAAARLLLDEELEAVGAPREVDHRIAAHPGQA